ncbi:unnamed protein product [Discosporangium mesarthrocarpum]
MRSYVGRDFAKAVDHGIRGTPAGPTTYATHSPPPPHIYRSCYRLVRFFLPIGGAPILFVPTSLGGETFTSDWCFFVSTISPSMRSKAMWYGKAGVFPTYKS